MCFHCHKIFLCLLLLVLLAGCKREERQTRVAPFMAELATSVPTTELTAGGSNVSAVTPDFKGVFKDYEGNAYQVSEGQNLFDQFNCSTCHANGGGDIGPPFLDEKWIYGHEPEQ